MNPTPTSAFDIAMLWLIAGWVVIGIGGLVLLWALFRDRSRGRRRCPKCWYDMKGVPGLRCPECGREVRSERKLLKTRRRWRWAVVAVLLMLAGMVSLRVPALQKDGWIAATPTFVLRAAAWVQRERARELFNKCVFPATARLPDGMPSPPPPLPVMTEWELVLAAWQAGQMLHDPKLHRQPTPYDNVDGEPLAVRRIFGSARMHSRVAMPDLVYSMDTEGWTESLIAVRDLAYAGNAEAIDTLARAASNAKHPDARHYSARYRTACALNRGVSLSAIDSMLASATDPNVAFGVASAATSELTASGRPKSAKLAWELIPKTLQHPEAAFRDRALGALPKLRDWTPLEETLIEMLEHDPSPVVREHVARFIQDETLSELWGMPLVRACEDDNSTVRTSAAETLVKWCGVKSWPAGQLPSWLLQRDIEAPMADGRKRDPLQWARVRLLHMDQYESPAAVHRLHYFAPGHPALFAMYQRWAMSHPEPAGRIVAIQVLTGMTETTMATAVELLGEVLANEVQAEVRLAAVRELSLRAAADARVLDLLADALEDESAMVQVAAATRLRQIGLPHPRAESILAEWTSHEDDVFAQAAATALEAIRAKKAEAGTLPKGESGDAEGDKPEQP